MSKSLAFPLTAALLLAVAVFVPAFVAVAADAPPAAAKADADGFHVLFDGKTLAGWKVGENAETFKVQDGALVVNGDRAHLFYDGPVKNHEFKDFHFKAEVMTFPNANSGIYFHTKFQESGWPAAGFECQVNNTYAKDPRKTASLYAVKDVKEALAKDNEWFQYEIIVQGRKVEIKINGRTANSYEVPADYKPPTKIAGRVLGTGTFALQGHDKGSKVMYRNIRVKPLD